MSLWIINKKQSGYHTIKRNEGYLPMVADVYGTDAEARLIAAAPDLLAALEEIVDLIGPNLGCASLEDKRKADAIFAAAREAIAKTKPEGGE
mgnify:CR=1 FL=1